MKSSVGISDPRELRRKLRLNQQDFWSRVGVTQSGGSRYETGRRIPRPVQELLRLVHVEGIALDVYGHVSEGSGENIFIVRDGALVTPPFGASILPGITRNTVFHICKDLGLQLVEKRITRDEVYIADEAFFTGTAAEVTPIRELDGRVIGEGKAGPVTKAIQKAFFDVVTGKDKKRRKWLTPVK
jgi:transcriptional regulator with XRE-family HTH domain